jgi:dynactin-5
MALFYNPSVEFTSEEYIQTSTGNIISREAVICRPQTVEIPNGRCIICPQVVIRGDLAPVQINKYCLIGARTSLHPCYTFDPIKGLKFIPQTIGSHCVVGEDCVVEAAVLGSGCVVEDRCVLSKRCILKDYVKVLEGSVVSPDMVIPPFSIVAGNPAQIVGEMPESTSRVAPAAAVERYRAYTLVKPSA